MEYISLIIRIIGLILLITGTIREYIIKKNSIILITISFFTLFIIGIVDIFINNYETLDIVSTIIYGFLTIYWCNLSINMICDKNEEYT